MLALLAAEVMLVDNCEVDWDSSNPTIITSTTTTAETATALAPIALRAVTLRFSIPSQLRMGLEGI